MTEAMVTGRMSEQKKRAGNRILARENLKPSQAINLMYQRLIEEKNARFLRKNDSAVNPTFDPVRMKEAFDFVRSIPRKPLTSEFDSMTKAEIKAHRLRAKGLM